MTNRERINAMSDKELVKFMEDIKKDELFPYYDFMGWFAGSDKKPKLKGRKAVYLKGGSILEQQVAKNEGRPVVIEKKPCTIVDEATFYSKPYYVIVVDGMNTFMKVSTDMVEEIK